MMYGAYWRLTASDTSSYIGLNEHAVDRLAHPSV